MLDSTALYDDFTTQDTVTLIRSALRALLRVVESELERELRAVLHRDDDYIGPGKPSCDWDDAAAREALVDALARDAYAALACLDDRKLEPPASEAAQLLATVATATASVSDPTRRERDGNCLPGELAALMHRCARNGSPLRASIVVARAGLATVDG